MRAARARSFLRALGLLAVVAACSSPHERAELSDRALVGFRESSPLANELIQEAAGVAVFTHVEGTSAGCSHDGWLLAPPLRPAGEGRRVVLRCLEPPRAPGGHSYHQLVVLRDPAQLEHLSGGPLDLTDFVHVPAHSAMPREDYADAPGWVVTTRRSQLLFDDPVVRQQLELHGTESDPTASSGSDSGR